MAAKSWPWSFFRAVLTFQAALKRPELFEQVIMIDPPLIMGKDAALHVAKTLKAESRR